MNITFKVKKEIKPVYEPGQIITKSWDNYALEQHLAKEYFELNGLNTAKVILCKYIVAPLTGFFKNYPIIAELTVDVLKTAIIVAITVAITKYLS